MRVRVAPSFTTTNTQGWLFSALGAKVAASRTVARMSSSTSSVAKFRHARWPCTTSKNSGIDAPERVDVEDAQGPVVRPVVEGRCPRPTAEVLGDSVGHALEPFLWVGSSDLVQVHEERITAVHTLMGRDHQPAADRLVVRCGDVVDVGEVGPAPNRLPGARLPHADQHEKEPERGLPCQHALAGTRNAPE